MRRVYVDGYNVINSWPILRELLDSSIESARQKLIEILQNYAVFTGYKVYIVFDAYMKKGSLGSKECYQDVQVVYTKEGETADSYIEKAINDIGRKNEVCVVTSDLLEQQLVFQRGAIRTSSTEFYFQVMEVQDKIKNKTKKGEMKNKNKLGDSIDMEVLRKLEKIRRNH